MDIETKFIDACVDLDFDKIKKITKEYGNDYITKNYSLNNFYSSITPLGAVIMTFHPYISNKNIDVCLNICRYLIYHGASLNEIIIREDLNNPVTIKEYVECISSKETSNIYIREIYNDFLNCLQKYENENDSLNIKDPGDIT